MALARRGARWDSSARRPASCAASCPAASRRPSASTPGSLILRGIILRGITLRGISGSDHLDVIPEGMREFGRGLREGTVVFPHARLPGIEQAPRAPRALRYDEQEGWLRPRRMASGHREYGSDDVHRLRAVRRLLEVDLTISDLKAFVDVLDTVFPPEGEAAVSDLRDRLGHSPVAEVATCRLTALDERVQGLVEVRGRSADVPADNFRDVFPDQAVTGVDRAA